MTAPRGRSMQPPGAASAYWRAAGLFRSFQVEVAEAASVPAESRASVWLSAGSRGSGPEGSGTSGSSSSRRALTRPAPVSHAVLLA
jgi:hypothetical protein